MPKLKTISLLGDGLKFSGWTPVLDLIMRFYQTDVQTIFELPKQVEVDACILLNHSRVLSPSELDRIKGTSLLFHSSDLPKGRGWAPLFNTVMSQSPLVQTALEVSEKVDSGKIYAKAIYPLNDNEINAEIARIDDHLTLFLLEFLLPYLFELKGQGVAQNEKEATYNNRRKKSDSAIMAKNDLEAIFDFLRALPPEAPAFFTHRARKFYLKLIPADENCIAFNPNKVKLHSYIGISSKPSL